MSTALLGRQTPRIQLAPPCAFNAGGDAVEFARRIGIPLDTWQKLALRNGMGREADGNWSAFEVCVICQRQNGKGSITDVLELYALFVLSLPVTIHSAHRLETSRKAFRVIKAIIERTPDLLRRVKPINDSDEHIETISGCRLEFRTRTRAGGRGLTCDLLILDEALELTDEQIAAIVPTLAAKPGAQLWYTSTVPASADQHLCKVRAAAQDGAPRLAYCEWGVDRGATVEETRRILADPAAHAEANPAYGSRLLPERLADLRRILGDEKFATECMGIWPDMAVGAVLDKAAWKRMLQPGGKRIGDVALSLDVAPLLDHGSIGMYAPEGGVPDEFGAPAPTGKEHVQVVAYREGIAWMVDAAAEYHEALDPICWVIDGKNGAHALLPELAKRGITVPEDPEQPHRGAVLVLGATEVADAVGQWLRVFRAEGFQQVGEEALRLAVENAKARPIGDAGQIAWGRRISDVDIGPLCSVTWPRLGYHAWADLVTDDYDLLESVR